MRRLTRHMVHAQEAHRPPHLAVEMCPQHQSPHSRWPELHRLSAGSHAGGSGLISGTTGTNAGAQNWEQSQRHQVWPPQKAKMPHGSARCSLELPHPEVGARKFCAPSFQTKCTHTCLHAGIIMPFRTPHGLPAPRPEQVPFHSGLEVGRSGYFL